MGFFKDITAGKYTNRKGKVGTFHTDGSWSVETQELVTDKFKQQLDAFHRIYMQQTLEALYKSETPPNSVGGYGVLTKKKLMSVWDEDWQTELDAMSEYYDVTYNSFFGIPEELPEATDFLTADEIVKSYGKT